MPHDALDQFATAIARAEVSADQAAGVWTAARDAETAISKRVEALSAERSVIISRRAAGDTRPDDGGHLALIIADLEGLQALLPNAHAVAAEARDAHAQAVAALGSVKAQFTAEEGRLTLATYDEHAAKLIEILQATLEHRRIVAAGLPPQFQNFDAIMARLHGFDTLIVNELAPVKLAIFSSLPYSRHPVWVPSEELYNRVWRQRHNSGRF